MDICLIGTGAAEAAEAAYFLDRYLRTLILKKRLRNIQRQIKLYLETGCMFIVLWQPF